MPKRSHYTIRPLESTHLKDAARLVSQRYQDLRRQHPLLPEKYTRLEVLLPMLEKIHQAEGGFVAFENSKLVGFLAGYLLPEIWGRPGAFSPEWANAAEMDDSRRIYEELYTAQAAAWVDQGYTAHFISMLINDRAGIEGWHWLGFGLTAADAIRPLQPIPFPDHPVDIRPATPDDVDTIMALDHGLIRHITGSPTYYPHKASHERQFYLNWLYNPQNAFWLAFQGAEPVAYMGFGPASDEACTIIVDDGTTSIPGAFTLQAARSSGIASALLNRGLEWAAQHGYQRCAVDFEPANPLAVRFWLRYFDLVCVSLARQIVLPGSI
jgi:GNAT superfamily N-acetyltransferase